MAGFVAPFSHKRRQDHYTKVSDKTANPGQDPEPSAPDVQFSLRLSTPSAPQWRVTAEPARLQTWGSWLFSPFVARLRTELCHKHITPFRWQIESLWEFFFFFSFSSENRASFEVLNDEDAAPFWGEEDGEDYEVIGGGKPRDKLELSWTSLWLNSGQWVIDWLHLRHFHPPKTNP